MRCLVDGFEFGDVGIYLIVGFIFKPLGFGGKHTERMFVACAPPCQAFQAMLGIMLIAPTGIERIRRNDLQVWANQEKLAQRQTVVEFVIGLIAVVAVLIVGCFVRRGIIEGVMFEKLFVVDVEIKTRTQKRTFVEHREIHIAMPRLALALGFIERAVKGQFAQEIARCRALERVEHMPVEVVIGIVAKSGRGTAAAVSVAQIASIKPQICI